VHSANWTLPIEDQGENFSNSQALVRTLVDFEDAQTIWQAKSDVAPRNHTDKQCLPHRICSVLPQCQILRFEIRLKDLILFIQVPDQIRFPELCSHLSSPPKTRCDNFPVNPIERISFVWRFRFIGWFEFNYEMFSSGVKTSGLRFVETRSFGRIWFIRFGRGKLQS
jgi:hypothetical protein